MSDRAPIRPCTEGGVDRVTAELERHASEARDDRRLLRLGVMAAVAVHVGLLAVRLPAVEDPPPPPPTVIPVPLDNVVIRPPEPPAPPAPPEEQPEHNLPVIHVPVPDDFATPPVELPPAPPPLDLDQLPQVAPPALPPPAEEPPLDINRLGIQPPRKIVSVEPDYPELPRTLGRSGTVVLELVVDRSGAVDDIVVLRPEPMGFTEAAVAAVRRWRYEPMLVNGVPREVRFRVTVVFRVAGR